MPYEFMQDPRWADLDEKIKQTAIGIAFADEVETDPRWPTLDKKIQESARNLYFEEARQFEQELTAPERRGFWGKAASHIGRGIVETLSSAGKALELADLIPREEDEEEGLLDIAGRNIVDWSKRQLEDTQFLRPDIGELKGEPGFLERGFFGGLEAIPQSSSIWALAGAGALMGTPLGAPGQIVGGVVGGLIGLVAMFGAGTYGKEYSEAYKELTQKRPNISEEEKRSISHRVALTSAAFEVGTELPSNLLVLGTLGGSKVLTQPVKATLRNLLRKPAKELARDIARQAAGEVTGEMIAGGGQAWARQREGLTGPTITEGVAESIIPSIVVSAFLGAGAAGFNRAQTKRAMDRLNSDNPADRFEAINKMAGRIAANTKDNDLAKEWHEAALNTVLEGKKFDFDERVVDFAQMKMAEDAQDEAAEEPDVGVDSIMGEKDITGAVAKFNQIVTAAEPKDVEVDWDERTRKHIGRFGIINTADLLRIPVPGEEEAVRKLVGEEEKKRAGLLEKATTGQVGTVDKYKQQAEIDRLGRDKEEEVRERGRETALVEQARKYIAEAEAAGERVPLTAKAWLEDYDKRKAKMKGLPTRFTPGEGDVVTRTGAWGETIGGLTPPYKPGLLDIEKETEKIEGKKLPPAKTAAQLAEEKEAAQKRATFFKDLELKLDLDHNKEDAEMLRRASLVTKKLTAGMARPAPVTVPTTPKEWQKELDLQAAELNQAKKVAKAPEDKAEIKKIEAHWKKVALAQNLDWNIEDLKVEALAGTTDIDAAAAQAEEPKSEAQAEAGNYKKGHTTLYGMPITIENKRGSIRRGVSKAGKKWATKMKHIYGYFKRTEGKDGDQVDVFVGPALGSKKAFIVDQVDPATGQFDEHKTLMGFKDIKAARAGYLANYEKGWKGLGAITELPIAEFKEWIGDGTRKTKAYSEELTKKTPEITAKKSEGEGGVTRYAFFNKSGDEVGSARMMGTTIGDIEVEEEFRKQGYGTAIAEHLKSESGKAGYPGSKAGRALMKKTGITVLGGKEEGAKGIEEEVVPYGEGRKRYGIDAKRIDDINEIRAEMVKSGETFVKTAMKLKGLSNKGAKRLFYIARSADNFPFMPPEVTADHVLEQHRKDPKQRYWYEKGKWLKEIFKNEDTLGLFRGLALIAHTSRNKGVLANVLEYVKIRTMEMSGEKKAYSGLLEQEKIDSILNAKNLEEMFDIVEGPIGVLSGETKVKAFAETFVSTIEGNKQLRDQLDSVIDIWMNRYLFPTKKLNEKGLPSPLSAVQHHRAQVHFRKVREILEKRTGETWYPDQIQAILWHWIRDNWTAATGHMGQKPYTFDTALEVLAKRYFEIPEDSEIPDDLMRAYINQKVKDADVRHILDRWSWHPERPLVDPKYQGKGQGGTELSGQLREAGEMIRPKVMYFYEAGRKPEDRFAALKRTRAVIDSSRLYDLAFDPDGYKVRFRTHGEKASAFDLADMEKQLIADGYIGIKKGTVIVMFEPTRVHEMQAASLGISGASGGWLIGVLQGKVKEFKGNKAAQKKLRDDIKFLKKVQRLLNRKNPKALNAMVMKDVRKIFDHPLIDIRTLKPARGMWEGEGEPSLNLAVEAGDPIVLKGKVAEFLQKYKQMAGLISTFNGRVKYGTSGKVIRQAGIAKDQAPSQTIYFDKPLSQQDQDDVSSVLKSNGISGSTYIPELQAMVLHHVKERIRVVVEGKERTKLRVTAAAFGKQVQSTYNDLTKTGKYGTIAIEGRWFAQDLLTNDWSVDPLGESYDKIIERGRIRSRNIGISTSPPTVTGADREGGSLFQGKPDLYSPRPPPTTTGGTTGGVTGVKEEQLPFESEEFTESLVSASGREVVGPGGVVTVAQRIAKDFKDGNSIDLRGQKASTPEDLAVLARVYRDPRYETIRIVYFKGNTIIGHEGLTARMPAQGPLVKKQRYGLAVPEKESAASLARGFNKIRSTMERLEADGYAVVHNHPSGDPSPSQEDINSTAKFWKEIPGLKWHVIINGKQYQVITVPKGIQKPGRIRVHNEQFDYKNIPDDWEDPLLESDPGHPAIGKFIMGAPEVADIGWAMNHRKGYVTLIFRDARGRVAAIQEVPRNLLLQAKTDKGIKHANDYIRGRKREFGAPQVIAYVRFEELSQDQVGVKNDTMAILNLMEAGALEDGIFQGGLDFKTSLREEGAVRIGQRRAEFEPRATAQSIREEIQEYAQPESRSESAAAKAVKANPKFQEWHKDSVVKESVYHAARTGDIEVFDGEKGVGWFYADEAGAHDDFQAGYAFRNDETDAPAVYPVYINIKNPLVMEEVAGERRFISDINDKYDLNIKSKRPYSWPRNREVPLVWEIISDKNSTFQDELRDRGYDGVIIKERNVKTYLVLRPNQIKSVFNLGTFSKVNPRIQYAATSKKPWPKGFPNVTVHTAARTLASHPDHKAAKAGDTSAALRISEKFVNAEKAKALGREYPRAVLVPVVAKEATGHNKIPLAVAKTISNISGLGVDIDLYQSNISSHTKKTGLQRLFSRATFVGKVSPGQQYILVDDVVAQGGTLSELRHYIENNGGEVVATTTLGYSKFSTVLAVRPEAIAKIERKFGRENTEALLKEHNIAGTLEALTQAEAKQILRYTSLDTFRSQISEGGHAAVFKADGRPLQEYSIKSQTPGGAGMTLPKIQTALAPAIKSGRIAVGLDANDGSIWVRTKSGPGLKIKSVRFTEADRLQFETITGNMSEDGIMSGRYEDGVIELDKDVSDISTLWHEINHFVTDKYLNKTDQSVLKRAFNKANNKEKGYDPTEEEIAYFVGDALKERDQHRGTAFGRVLQRIIDFLDGLINVLKPTARGVLKSYETGQVFERGAGVNEFAQPVRLSIRKAAKNIMDNAAFRKWFGGSKVTTEDGKPLVVYHGTDAKENFEIFRKALYDVGIHFGSAEVAQSRLDYKARPLRKGELENRERHRLIPAYLSLQNPLILDSDPTMWNPDNLPFFLEHHTEGVFTKAELKELGKYESLSYEAEVRAAGEYGIELDDIENKGNEDALDALEEYRGEVESEFTERFVEMLEDKGYDGIIYQNDNETTGKGIEPSYIAFHPTQIKSIYNRGTFSETDPRIHFQKTAQRWYSQMESFLSDKLPNKGTGKGFLATVQSWAKKGLIKQEELEWSGLEDYIAGKAGITKAEVLGWLAENNVRVQEVKKRGIDPDERYDDLEERYAKNQRLDWEVSYDEDEQAYVAYDPNGEILHDFGGGLETFKSEDEAESHLDFMFREDFRRMPPEEASEIIGIPIEGGGTKFDRPELNLPGGRDYRELLLTLPVAKNQRFDVVRKEDGKVLGSFRTQREAGKFLLSLKGVSASIVPVGTTLGAGYQGTHYDEKDILAHIRFDTRTDAQGRKVLFIQEIQSDWAQAGRSKYEREVKRLVEGGMTKAEAVKKVPRDFGFGTKLPVYKIRREDGTYGLFQYESIEQARDGIETGDYEGEKVTIEKVDEISIGVPSAPFVKDTGKWTLLALKRMVRMAAEQGYGAVAWTPGEVQTERYDLSKQVAYIRWGKTKENDSFKLNILPEGRNKEEETTVDGQGKLEDTIGKEAAEKIINATEQTGRLNKPDLKVGGEGMKGFYDRILPSVANKFFGKAAWGKARVGVTELGTGKADQFIVEPATNIPGEKWWVTDTKNESDTGRLHDTEAEAIQDAKELNEAATVKAKGQKVWQLPITPEMRDKALYEGMPQFAVKKGPQYATTYQETTEDTTAEDYEAYRKANKNVKLKASTVFKQAARETKLEIERLIAPISTRLARINKVMSSKIRRLDYDTAKAAQDDTRVAMPLMKGVKDMSRDDLADFDYAKTNSDTEKINALCEKYGLEKENAAVREMLSALRKKAIDVGLDIGEILEYSPRFVRDLKGLMSEMNREQLGVYSQAMKDKADEMGVGVEELDPDMRANTIVNIILGGPTGMGTPGATKSRKFKKVPVSLMKYYMRWDQALVKHINDMHNSIEKRKFFGKIPEKVAEMRRQMFVAQGKIRDYNKRMRAAETEDDKEKLRKKRNEWIGTEKQLRAYLDKYAAQRDYTDNIGAYIDELIVGKKISADQEDVVRDILHARFHERGTHGFFAAYKNFSYMDTMGSPISALTQIGDLAWAMYDAGLVTALKHAKRSIFKQNRITREDVGATRIGQEFADPNNLGSAVSWVFKMVGLEKIDAIGKETLLNAAYERYQKEARKNPKALAEKIRHIFEGETEGVVQDLINDNITDNVKVLVYNRLVDFQPIALSEMPQRYLSSGNGRIFYMLKTFTIKQFDAFRNESLHKLRTGDRAEKIQATKNLMRLAMFFVLANATADELKDFVLGPSRKTDFSDRVADNVLRLGGASKFIVWKARTEGFGSAAARQVLPPFKFIDSASKDIYNAGDDKGLEIVGSIPLVGKLAYWHIGRGTSKREDLWDRRLKKHKAGLRKVKEQYDRSKDKTAFMKEHRKELTEYRRANKFQGQLNKYRTIINKLKSQEETPSRTKRIKQLENKRTELIKKYLSKGD